MVIILNEVTANVYIVEGYHILWPAISEKTMKNITSSPRAKLCCKCSLLIPSSH